MVDEWKLLPLAERTERLEEIVSVVIAGGVVVSQGATMVTIRYSQPVNNVLHAILSIFTCGLWLFVWFIVGVMAKPPRNVRVWVDEYGRVSRDDGPRGSWVEQLPAVRSAV